jgi:hypothetical protein
MVPYNIKGRRLSLVQRTFLELFEGYLSLEVSFDWGLRFKRKGHGTSESHGLSLWAVRAKDGNEKEIGLPSLRLLSHRWYFLACCSSKSYISCVPPIYIYLHNNFELIRHDRIKRTASPYMTKVSENRTSTRIPSLLCSSHLGMRLHPINIDVSL